MIEAAILDTGPLVAFLHSNEHHHRWVAEQFKQLPPKFLTCEPVLTEACFLLGFADSAMKQIGRFLELGIIQVPFQFASDRRPVMQLMHTYRNVPMSLADACLVRMSELYPDAPVFTLDEDFLVYRRNKRQQIQTILPPRK